MILNYYGGYANIERIRRFTNTTNKGTSAYHLIEAAKQFGFHAYGVKTTLNKKKLLLPFIAHLKIDDTYYHYVVVYQIIDLRQTVLVADPARGIMRLSFQKFMEKWTGVAILLYPIRPIEQFDSKQSFVTFLLLIISAFKKETIRLFCFSLIIGFCSLATSFFTKWMFDALEENMGQSYFYILFFTGATLYFFLHITEYLKTRLYVSFYHKVHLFLTSNIIKRLLYQPQQYYQHRSVGEMLSRVEDLPVIQNFLGICYDFFSFDLFMFFTSMILLYRINQSLFEIEFFLIFLYFLIFSFTYRMYQNKNYQVKVKKSFITTTLSDLFSSLTHIQGIHLEPFLYEILLKKYFSYFKQDRSYQISTSCYQFFYTCINDIGILLQFFVGCLFILDRKLTIGNLLLFELLSGYLKGGILKFTSLYFCYSDAKNVYLRISYLFLKDERVKLLPYTLKGNININDLSYSYQNEMELFKHLSLNIKKGEKILIMGASGSGKSTLLKILMKYESINRGTIFFDGVDSCDISSKDIKRKVTYVTQKGILFSDTLKQNILLSRLVEPKLFSEVLTICDIPSILKKHRLGMNTILDDTSLNLSGGERQRIILARALLNSFQILLLDEATNQLDEKLEYKILRLLFWKYSDKTIIVVSHRMNLPHLYNHIYELKNGVLQERCIH